MTVVSFQNANTQAIYNAQQQIQAALNQTTSSQTLANAQQPIATAFATGATSAAGAAASAVASQVVPASGAPTTPSNVGGSTSTSGSNNATNATQTDTRIRISPILQSASQVYGAAGSSNVLSPIIQTNGMLFPYTPQITFTQDVTYQDIPLTHANMDILAYTRTPSVTLSIQGKFTCMTPSEGAYSLACLHFLRTVSKMYFGETDAAAGKAGLPPPILVLNGYGTYMFNNLKVVLKSHTFTYEENMDTVLVSTAGGTARLPALFTIGLTLVVQQTPRAMRKDFSLDAFRTGALMLKGGWI